MTQTRRWLLAAALLAAGGPAAAQSTADLQPTPERPFLLLDQVKSVPFPATLAPVFQPLKTLEAVEAALKANKLAYRRGRVLFDTRTARPDFVRAIAGLPRGEIYIIPQADGVTFNVVIKALTPEAAAALRRAPKT